MEKKKWENRIIQAAIILFIAVFTFQIILHVNKVQKITNIANDCNELATKVQRIVKLTAAQQDVTTLHEDIDGLWRKLLNSEDNYGSERISSPEYWSCLQEANQNWQKLSSDLSYYVSGQYNLNTLIESSESFYKYGDRLNDTINHYSLSLIEKLKIYELLLITFVIGLIAVYFKQLITKMKLANHNGELRIMSYFDESTQLPNRRRCREILSETLDFEKNECYACIMFDLNNLKSVNDTYGHKFGDVLIASFSSILRKYINDEVFIGRYGGDEFVAIIKNHDERRVLQMLESIQASVDKFNDEHHEIPIRFAYGYDIAYKGKKIKMEEVAERADINMYKCKKQMKDCDEQSSAPLL